MYSVPFIKEFFTVNMPATKALIEELWTSDPLELDALLKEYMMVMGPHAYGYGVFSSMQEHVKENSHKYPNPWDIL